MKTETFLILQPGPPISEGIVRYLAEYAETLALSTLRQRLAALAQWHITQGFPDPTKSPQVRQMLKGIRVVHPAQQKQATPLQLRHLHKAVDWLDKQAGLAIEAGDYRSLMRFRRDTALLLIGFWRGFRSDEPARLRVETTQQKPASGSPSTCPIPRPIVNIMAAPSIRRR